MLIVTHEMQFARDISDRVLYFDQRANPRVRRAERDFLQAPGAADARLSASSTRIQLTTG